MALIETAPNSPNIENNIRMACADELAAQSLYRDLKSQVQSREDLPPADREAIIKRLDEIIKDEEEHFGSLLFCINLLNPKSMINVNNGSKGA